MAQQQTQSTKARKSARSTSRTPRSARNNMRMDRPEREVREMSEVRDVRTQRDARKMRIAPLRTPTDLGENATRDISGALNACLADVYALYLKTKNFHWHMSGTHFRDLHLLLDEQGEQIFAMTDALAERVRKIGGTTLRSVGHIAHLQRIPDNDADFVTPEDMLSELCQDNRDLTAYLRARSEEHTSELQSH